MKTNFFEQVAGLAVKGTLQINIQPQESGSLTVSVMLTSANPKTTAGKNIPPMLLKGEPQELDEAFFQQLAEPVRQTVKLFANLEAYQSELDKAQKTGKKDKDKDKTGKAAPGSDAGDDEDENSNDLFKPQADDKQAKAEKKRLYEDAMQKVNQLNSDMKYREAIAQLPDAEEYPDKAEEINTKRAQLQKRQELYTSLQQEV